jgi:hypothetical protein
VVEAQKGRATQFPNKFFELLSPCRKEGGHKGMFAFDFAQKNKTLSFIFCAFSRPIFLFTPHRSPAAHTSQKKKTPCKDGDYLKINTAYPTYKLFLFDSPIFI